MVKNTSGGSRAKSQARKLSVVPRVATSVRLKNDTCEDEIYAVVIKNFGSGRCLVKTTVGEEIQCVIRGAFRGRNRGANFVSVGSILLIGKRSWESNSNTCDLIEVYTAEEEMVLRALPTNPIHTLYTETHAASDSVDELIFTTDAMAALSTEPRMRVPATIAEEENAIEGDVVPQKKRAGGIEKNASFEAWFDDI
jgi:hypothetical protein